MSGSDTKWKIAFLLMTAITSLVVTSSYTVGLLSSEAKSGTLTISTTPVTGEVFVNGESWGMAPQIRVLPVGTYTVSFGDVSGYTTPTTQLTAVTSIGVNVVGTYLPTSSEEDAGESGGTGDSSGTGSLSITGQRFGWWFTHPLGQMDGRSVKQWFDAYFLTPPYPSWIEMCLTDYEKWSDLSNSETQRYLQLLTYADEYPAIKISFMLGFRIGAESQGVQLQALNAFCAEVAQHPSTLSVGVMTEYVGFQADDKASWEAVRDAINSHGLPMVSYRSGLSYGTCLLPVSEGFYDIFHTNYPLVETHKDPSQGDPEATLSWGDDPEYNVGISAGYWDDFTFPGTSNSDGLPRGWNQYSTDAVISTAVDVHRSTGTRQLVSVCQMHSTSSFTGVSGVSTRQMWDNPTWRTMIWNSPDYQSNFTLSTS